MRSVRAARLAIAACLAVAAAWIAALAAAPHALDAPAGSAARLGAGTVYLLGRAVCHQRPERSFTAAGHPMPVCARCTGLYAAAPVACLTALVLPFGRGRRTWAWAGGWRGLALAAAPTAATVLFEWASGWTAAGVRAAAGAPLGFAGAALVCVALTQPIAARRACGAGQPD